MLWYFWLNSQQNKAGVEYFIKTNGIKHKRSSVLSMAIQLVKQIDVYLK